MINKEILINEWIINRKSQNEISKELSVSLGTVEYWIKKHGLIGKRTKTKFTCNSSKFSLENPIFWYYCGLIATDGYVDIENNRAVLILNNQGCETVLNNLINHFEYSGKLKCYKGNYNFKLVSKELMNQLSKVGLYITNKTFDLKFPNIEGDDNLKMFLRGCLDGDGNINVKKSNKGGYIGGQFRIVTASNDFIKGIINSINTKFGFNYELSCHRTKGKAYPKLEMRVDDSITFYNWLYQGYEDFRFPDKYNKYLNINKVNDMFHS